MAGLLDSMTFEGPFQPKPLYESIILNVFLYRDTRFNRTCHKRQLFSPNWKSIMVTLGAFIFSKHKGQWKPWHCSASLLGRENHSSTYHHHQNPSFVVLWSSVSNLPGHTTSWLSSCLTCSWCQLFCRLLSHKYISKVTSSFSNFSC